MSEPAGLGPWPSEAKALHGMLSFTGLDLEDMPRPQPVRQEEAGPLWRSLGSQTLLLVSLSLLWLWGWAWSQVPPGQGGTALRVCVWVEMGLWPRSLGCAQFPTHVGRQRALTDVSVHAS